MLDIADQLNAAHASVAQERRADFPHLITSRTESAANLSVSAEQREAAAALATLVDHSMNDGSEIASFPGSSVS